MNGRADPVGSASVFLDRKRPNKCTSFVLLLLMLSTTNHPGGVKKKEEDRRHLQAGGDAYQILERRKCGLECDSISASLEIGWCTVCVFNHDEIENQVKPLVTHLSFPC